MDRRDWELLGLTTTAFFATMVARLAPSPLVTDIMGEFLVSKSTVGLALSGMWAAYALCQFPGGVIADRVGERRVILGAIATTGSASVLLAAAPTFPLFAAFAVVLGGGAGLYTTAGASFLTAEFENTGRALGIHEMGASAAGVVAPVASAYAANSLGWRAGPVVPAVVALVVVALVAWRVPRTPPAAPDRSLRDQLDLGRLFELLARRRILFTTVVGMVGFFTWQSFASFFPTFLVEYAGRSQATASLIFGGTFALTVAGAPALGWLSDLTSRDAVIAGSMLAGAAGYAVLLSLPTTAAALAGAALVGVGLSWPGVVNSRFMDGLAEDERGTGFGLVRAVVLLVSSLGSAVTGALAEIAGWFAAYGSVAALLALVVVLLAANRVLGIGA